MKNKCNKIQQIVVPESPFSTPLVKMVLLEKINPKKSRYMYNKNEYVNDIYEFFINGVRIIVEETNHDLKKGQIIKSYDYLGTLKNILVKANPEEVSTDSEYIWRISRLIFKSKSYLNCFTNQTVYKI